MQWKKGLIVLVGTALVLGTVLIVLTQSDGGTPPAFQRGEFMLRAPGSHKACLSVVEPPVEDRAGSLAGSMGLAPCDGSAAVRFQATDTGRLLHASTKSRVLGGVIGNVEVVADTGTHAPGRSIRVLDVGESGGVAVWSALATPGTAPPPVRPEDRRGVGGVGGAWLTVHNGGTVAWAPWGEQTTVPMQAVLQILPVDNTGRGADRADVGRHVAAR